MRKGKALLTILAMLAIVGGALGYKANRGENVFYLDTTTVQGGAPHSICSRTTTYTLVPNPAGVRTIKASPIPLDMTCPVISVVPSL